MKHASLVLALVLALTGCASSPAAEDDETTTPAASEEEPESTPTPTAEAGPLVLCEIMSEKLLDYPDYVLAIAEGDFDQATHDEYLTWAEEMEAAAPADASVPLAKFTSPIHQVQDVVEAGGGALTFSTDDYKAGNLEIMEYCVDAGFTMEN